MRTHELIHECGDHTAALTFQRVSQHPRTCHDNTPDNLAAFGALLNCCISSQITGMNRDSDRIIASSWGRSRAEHSDFANSGSGGNTWTIGRKHSPADYADRSDRDAAVGRTRGDVAPLLRSGILTQCWRRSSTSA